MPRPAKDETGRFIQAIAAFSAAPEPVTSLGRALSPCDGGPSHAILRELNETVLRRKLVFSDVSGAQLSLVAGERRLLSVAALPERLAAAFQDLAGQTLSEEDTAPIMSLLAEFCAGREDVFVTSYLTDSGAAEFGGLPVRVLMDQADAAAAMLLPQAIPDAVTASEPIALAIVCFENGHATLEKGDGDLCAVLKQKLQSRIDARATPDGVTLWQGSDELGPATLHVRLGQVDVALACDAGHMSECFDLWRRVVAAPAT